MRANRLQVLLVMFGLTLAGLALQRGDLTALALPLLVYLGIAFWYAPARPPLPPKPGAENRPAPVPTAQEVPPHFVLERTLARKHASPGQAVATVLQIRNEGPALDEVCVTSLLPGGVTLIQGAGQARLPSNSGETARLAQTLQARRGDYQFPGALISANESLGLFGVELVASAPARLSVEPVGEVLRPFILRPPQTRGFAGPVPARQGGRGTDFFSVREYQLGDSLRQINWKVSSRAERTIYTNVFEQQRIADVGIILDAREQVDLHNSRLGSMFEYSVRVAVTLTEPILKAGNRLGLLVYGPGMESVFPGYGKVQQRRILKALTRAGAGHNYALESLAHLPTRFFPAGSQIILISPLQTEDPPLVANLVTLGYGVLLISPNPLVFENVGGEADKTPDDLAWRLACAERRFQMQHLQRRGVQVIDWDVRDSLAPLLHAALRQAARRR
jgi:uncharacterized protein (DUF58 family)